jgi:hypothetical protein
VYDDRARLATKITPISRSRAIAPRADERDRKFLHREPNFAQSIENYLPNQKIFLSAPISPPKRHDFRNDLTRTSDDFPQKLK